MPFWGVITEPRLDVRLLGHFSLALAGAELDGIHSARLQTLFAYLLLHRHAPQPRHQLAFLFWPDTSEAQAQTNLRQLLHTLRRRLPEADRFVEVTDKTVRWRDDAPFTADVIEFEGALAEAAASEGDARLIALERAAAIYGGDLLPGRYDDWLLHERERLAERFLETLEQLILLLERRRDYEGAIGYARRLLQHDPLHEPAYRQLMHLHALNGERAAALHVYQVGVTALRRELGMTPSTETRELYQGLLDLERGATPAPVMAGDAHFVGRQAEWHTLQERWHLTQRGGVHCVCLSGEPGIGKTRLAEEVIRWAQQQGIPTAATRAYAEGDNLAYAPLVALLRSGALSPRLRQVEAVWRGELGRLLPELTAEHPRLPRPVPLTQRWQVQRLYDAVGRVLLASGRPLILLLDDLQWFDHETVAWLRYLLRAGQQSEVQGPPAQRLLVLGTLRSGEFDEGHPLAHLLLDLRRGDRLTELELSPLSAAESGELASRVAGRPLDAAAAKAIHRATEGNPLFIVETVRASPLPAASNGSAPAPPLAPKVQTVIRARLAHLSPAARELAGLAAAIGRSFAYDVLALASDQDESTLVRSLDELWRRRIVREQGLRDYDFSHDRIRDVAYAEMSAARRSLCHRRTAQALESLHASDLDPVSGLIAGHYERAGMTKQAISYYRLAAEVAQRLYANQDALDYSERGLELLESLPDTARRAQQELRLQIIRGTTTGRLKGHGAPMVGEAYARARDLAERAGTVQQRFRAMIGLRAFYFVRAEHQRAYEISQELLTVALSLQEPAFLLEAHRVLGVSLFHLGELASAHEHLAQAIVLYAPDQDRTYASVHDIDPGVVARCLMGRPLWSLGYPDQALKIVEEGLSRLRQPFQPFTQVYALNLAVQLHQFRREAGAVVEQAGALVAQAAESGFDLYWAIGTILKGWGTARQGQAAQGIAQMQEGLAQFDALGASWAQPYFLALLAEAYQEGGRIGDALNSAGQALIRVEKTAERWYEPELLRLQGDLLLARGTAGVQAEVEAESRFRQALAIARQQDAKSLELRAAVSLGCLWRRQGRRQEARELLAAIHGWFSEGFATPDLQAARQLLDELSHPSDFGRVTTNV